METRMSEYTYNGMTLRVNDCVELEDGSYLKIKHFSDKNRDDVKNHVKKQNGNAVVLIFANALYGRVRKSLEKSDAVKARENEAEFVKKKEIRTEEDELFKSLKSLKIATVDALNRIEDRILYLIKTKNE